MKTEPRSSCVPDSESPRWQRLLLTVLVCVAATLVATPLLGYIDLANIVMLFLLVVLIIAVRLGRDAAILASILSVLLFDLFFVPPRFSLAVSNLQYLITFAVMLATALITTHLTAVLQQRAREAGQREPLNMIVPIDLLKPILEDLLTIGRANQPPRPWLGLYAMEVEDRIVIAGLSSSGPAERGGLKTGDVVVAVADTPAKDLAGVFRKIWSLGSAGVEVPLKIWREGRTLDLRIASGDRNRFLKGPSLH